MVDGGVVMNEREEKKMRATISRDKKDVSEKLKGILNTRGSLKNNVGFDTKQECKIVRGKDLGDICENK